MIEKWDAASRRWPWPARVLYHAVKWAFVGLGAFLLIGNMAIKWGTPAAAWFLIVPLLWGLWLGRRTPPE